jgi:hypothetical protein
MISSRIRVCFRIVCRGDIDLIPFTRVWERNDDEAIPAGRILWGQKFRTELDRTRNGVVTSCMRGVIRTEGYMVYLWERVVAPKFFMFLRREYKHQAVLGATLCMYILLTKACEAERALRQEERCLPE